MQGGPRVLVVNAVKEVRSAVAGCLTDRYDVAQAGSGREALGILQEGPVPSALFVDFLLPDIEADEFLCGLRSDPRLAGIPIIAITGLYRRPCAETADAQVRKPFQPRELLEVLTRLVSARAEGGGRAE